MKHLHHVYQSLPVGMMLCAIGGSLDADSFLLHGHVFAGLQTGNLVMLGAGYSQLNSLQIFKYVAALTGFVLGLILTRFFLDKYRYRQHSISQFAVAISSEIILLLAVCLFSKDVSDFISVAVMSFVGAIQLQTFELIEGNSFTPLMMMGHMKKAINFFYHGRPRRVITNVASLLSFFMGAVITGLLITVIADWALVFAILMLISIIIYANVK